jgi:hypothetical protein
MGDSSQNHALVFFVYLSRLVQYKHAVLDEHNPKALLLDTFSSGVFLCGRDINDQPYLGVPSELMPFFTQIDWVEASICRKKGYLFLEARDPATQSLQMAFGIKIRRKRLNVFCVKDHENIDDLSLNIKVFEQDKNKPTDVIFADEHELVNITLKEINSTLELGTEMDAEEARTILVNSGVDHSFTPIKLSM